MNNDQLEACLKSLKSSSVEPDSIDSCLEERMMELCVTTTRKRRRTRRWIAMMALLMVFCTGFVAMGGDRAVLNYLSPSTEMDEEGNLVPHDFSLGKWMHRLHDHLWEHFHGAHGGT